MSDFSIPRRVPGLVDVLFPKQAGVVGYRLKASPQFDGTPAFATILTASISSGYLDGNVDRRTLTTYSGQSFVRAAFNPDTFQGTAGIADSSQFWVKFVPVDVSDSEGSEGNPTLILTPDQHHGTARIAITGDAPAAADISGSLTLDLGHRMSNIIVRNNGSNPLFLAFGQGSAEIELATDEVYSSQDSAQSYLIVRGQGGVAAFEASFTVAQGYKLT